MCTDSQVHYSRTQSDKAAKIVEGFETPKVVVLEVPDDCDARKAVGFRCHNGAQYPRLYFIPVLMHHAELCWQPAGYHVHIVGTADDGRQHLAGLPANMCLICS
jgi:hypothetical protein